MQKQTKIELQDERLYTSPTFPVDRKTDPNTCNKSITVRPSNKQIPAICNPLLTQVLALIRFEKKNLRHTLQLAVVASVYMECIIPFNSIQ